MASSSGDDLTRLLHEWSEGGGVGVRVVVLPQRQELPARVRIGPVRRGSRRVEALVLDLEARSCPRSQARGAWWIEPWDAAQAAPRQGLR